MTRLLAALACLLGSLVVAGVGTPTPARAAGPGAAPVARTAVAKPRPTPPPPRLGTSRTYQVQYVLAGSYTSSTHYTDASVVTSDWRAFCAGTGFDEQASFSQTAATTLTLRPNREQYLSGGATGGRGALGQWRMTGTTVARDDPCTAQRPEACSGAVSPTDDYLLTPRGGTITAVSSAARVGLRVALSSTPAADLGTGCDTAAKVLPTVVSHLEEALRPYALSQVTIPWSRLLQVPVAGTLTLTTRFDPASTDPEYDVASCNHLDACTAAFTDFRSELVLTRVS